MALMLIKINVRDVCRQVAKISINEKPDQDFTVVIFVFLLFSFKTIIKIDGVSQARIIINTLVKMWLPATIDGAALSIAHCFLINCYRG